MKLYDVSMPIHEQMPVYNDNRHNLPVIEVVRDFDNGRGVRESRLSINLHTGTHMDAPLHMVKDGADTACFKLENMVLKAKVLDLTHIEDCITKEVLISAEICEGDFLIFKTRNSFYEGFDKNFVFVEKSGAGYLVEQKVKGIGIDALGIERSQPGYPSHVTLMNNGVIILEGLRLKDVPAGGYTLLAAPINIKNVEAAPVRALLMDCH